MFAYPSPNTTQ